MGKSVAAAADAASYVQTGTFTAAGQDTTGLPLVGEYAFVLTGTFSGEVVGEIAYDGTNYVPIMDMDGNPSSFTAAGSYPFIQREPGCLVRFRCVTLASGTPGWRVSR